jgi:autotransporter-associated beta strand protein
LDNTTGAGIVLARNFLQTWTGDFTFKGTGQSLTMGTGAVTLSGGTRQVTVASKTLVQNGAIGDGGNGYGLTKSGTGSLTLTAINTYTGATTVSAGTLILSGTGSIATSGTITVASGAVLNVSGVTGGFSVASGQSLMGSGTVTGALSVGSGGRLAVGNSPGTMTFNNDLTLSAGSLGDFEINGLTSGLYDLARGGAGVQAVAFGGTLNLIFQAGFSTLGTVKIFDFESYAGNFSGVNTSGLASGYSASFDQLTGVVTVIPEPSTCALLGAALWMTLTLGRKRRMS